jgi:hypothetical protein
MSSQILLLINGPEIPDFIWQLTDQLKAETGREVLVRTEPTAEINGLQPSLPKRWKPTLFSSTTPRNLQHDSDCKPELTIDLRPVFIPRPECAKVIRCDFFTGSRNWAFPRLAACIVEQKTVIDINIQVFSDQYDKASLVENAKLHVNTHNYRDSLEYLIHEVNLLLTKSARFVLNSAYFEKQPERPSAENKPIPYTSFKVFSAQLKNLIVHRLNQFSTASVWNCAQVNLPIHELALSQGNHTQLTHWMKEGKKGTFKADPFAFSLAQSEPVLFYEHYQSGRGIICSSHKNTPILDGSHFSYPYTFEFDNQRYILPENIESDRLVLYQLNDTLDGIKNRYTLLNDFRAVDPSIVFYNHKWWLFCTDGKNKGADTRLHLFYADTLTEGFKPHPNNPVKTDICSARPAGHLFIHQDTLYRPGQNSGATYGGEIIVHRIEQLSTVEFHETAINTLSPQQFGSKYPNGLHTISACGEMCYIDGKRFRKTLNFPLRRRK